MEITLTVALAIVGAVMGVLPKVWLKWCGVALIAALALSLAIVRDKANAAREADVQKEREAAQRERDTANRRDEAYRGQIQQLQQQVSEGDATIAKLILANAPRPLPPPPTLMLHDVYGESWGLSRPGDPAVNLETASPLKVPMNVFHRIDPCAVSPEGLSAVWIYLTYPPDVEVRIDKRLWQEWPDSGKKTYAAAFGNLNPNNCSVKGMQDGSGGAPMEFRATREGQFDLGYRITGRVAETQISLRGDQRKIVIDAIKP